MFNTLLQHYYVHRVCGQQAYGEVSFYIKQYDFNTQVIFIFSFLNGSRYFGYHKYHQLLKLYIYSF